jgi:hypothetical protein
LRARGTGRRRSRRREALDRHALRQLAGLIPDDVHTRAKLAASSAAATGAPALPRQTAERRSPPGAGVSFCGAWPDSQPTWVRIARYRSSGARSGVRRSRLSFCAQAHRRPRPLHARGRLARRRKGRPQASSFSSRPRHFPPAGGERAQSSHVGDAPRLPNHRSETRRGAEHRARHWRYLLVRDSTSCRSGLQSRIAVC